MNILFIAPQPFYQERGTPIAVRLALETLCAAGHRVDLVTFHEGQDLHLEGLRHLRIARPPVSGVPIGFSWKKLVCDAYLFFTVAGLLARNDYQVLHAVEEAVFLCLPLAPLTRGRLVYDMDSSLADQLIEKWGALRRLGFLLHGSERLAVRHADMVLPVCEALAERVKQHAPAARLCVLNDVAFDPPPDAADRPTDLRRAFGIAGLLALYVGNLEPYQGVGRMIEAMALLPRGGPPIDLVILGGSPEHIARHRAEAERLGVAGRVHLAGPRPLASLPRHLAQADILVSPRLKGVNTPMKVYSYLKAGRAILATAIRSHTQVLDPSSAMLVGSEPAALAAGLQRLAGDPELRERLGRTAARLAAERYGADQFRRTLLAAYARLEADVADGAAKGRKR